MSSYAGRLDGYLPQVIVGRLSTQGGPPATPVMDTLHGAVLYAEITGLTAFADRSAHAGAEGGKHFHTLVNRYADQLFEVIRSHGGDLIAFSGDGFSVLWPAGRQAFVGDAVLAALRCSRQIQSRLGRYQIGNGRRIGLRIGVGAGELSLLHLGSPQYGWRMLMRGPAVLEAQGAAAAAPPAAAFVGRCAWGFAEGYALGMKLKGTDWVHLQDISPDGTGPSRVAATSWSVREADLLSHLPRAVHSEAGRAHAAWDLSVLHVRLGHGGEPLETANHLLQIAQQSLERYEGSLDEILVDSNAMHIVASFGLPPFSADDAAVRATLAALDLQEEMRKLGRSTPAGITTGLALCGSYGGGPRRAFSVISDLASLASRLAEACGDDGLLCDQQTAQDAGLRLIFDPLPPISVKGKVEMVSVYRPRREALPQEAAYRYGTGPVLVGRNDERYALAASLDRLEAGEGGLLCLVGEAGMGKSALLGELMHGARERGVLILAGAGDSFDQRSPYHAWRTVLMGALGLRPGQSPELLRGQVQQLLGEEGLHDLTPAVCRILTPGAHEPGSDEGTEAALNRLLKALFSRYGKVLLVLEDAHWFDAASWRLMLAVIEEAGPLLMAVTTRPLEKAAPQQWSALQSAPGTRTLILRPHTPAETLELIRQRLKVRSVPSAVVDLIVQRAEGNPFFSEQIAYALVEAGLLVVSDGESSLAHGAGDLRHVALPGRLQGLVTDRLLNLPPTQQLTLQVASLIGRLHAFRLLRDVYPIDDDRSQVIEHMSSLQRLKRSAPEAYEPDLTYVFRHATSQEATYNLMLFAQRRQLHRAVADWYEQTQASDLPRYYALLAYHYRRAEVPEKALLYADRAGEQALRYGAYREAVTHLIQAIELGDDSTSSSQMAQWEFQLAQALYGLGRWEESQVHFERAADLIGYPLPKDAVAVRNATGKELLRQFGHRAGVVARAHSAGERERLLLAARIYREVGPVYAFAKELGKTLHAAVGYLNLAERAGGLTGELAGAYTTMCLASGMVPLHAVARAYARRAREVAERAGDLAMLGNALQGTALYAYGTADWEYAYKAVRQAMEIFSSLGARRQYMETRSLTSLFLQVQGRLSDARAAYEVTCQAAVDADDIQLQSYATGALVLCLLTMGLEEEAKSHVPALEALAGMHETEEAIVTRWWAGYGAWRADLKPFPQPEMDAVLAQILPRRPMEPYMGLLLGSLCDAHLALLPDAAQPGQILHGLRQLVRKFREAASIYPVAEPGALYYAGRLALAEDRPRQAKRLLTRAILVATKRALPLEAALAHGALAPCLGLDTVLGRQHLQTAREGLASLGADYYLRLLPPMPQP